MRRQRTKGAGQNEVGPQSFTHLMRDHSTSRERESGVSCKQLNRAKRIGREKGNGFFSNGRSEIGRRIHINRKRHDDQARSCFGYLRLAPVHVDRKPVTTLVDGLNVIIRGK